MKWNKSQVSMLFFVGIVLILAAASTTSYRIIYKLLITSSQQQALLKVQQARDDIDHWLKNRKIEVSTIADTPTVQTMDWSLIKPYFKSQINRLQEYQHMTLAFPDGHYLNTNVPPNNYSLRQRPWFKAAMKGIVTANDPSIGLATRVIQITIGTPIKSSAGKIIGAVNGSIRINRVVKVVQDIGSGQDSYAFVLNSAGQMIFSPDAKAIATIDHPVTSLLKAKDSELSKVAQFMLHSDRGINLFRLNGSWKYVAYMRLKEARWIIALVIPTQTIESPLNSLNLLAGVLGSLMVIAVFGVWRQIQLSQIAEEIAQEKSLLYAQTQAQVEQLDQSLQERHAIEDVLRQQTQNLETTLKELHETQSQLLQSEKMSSLGQLVAGIAHEVNNPVNFIHGNLIHVNQYIVDLIELLHLYQQYYPQPALEISDRITEIELDFLCEDLPKLISSMNVGSERIREIVKSLRNFSRLDEAEVKLVNIHEGIDSTLMILQHRLKATGDRSGIEVIKEYSDLPLVECYAGQLNQVFMNILNNAIDAIDELNTDQSARKTQTEPGRITIKTEVKDYLKDPLQPQSLSPNSQVLIRIANNGPSIDQRIQQRLFEPFFSTKPVGRGAGLGMSISYSIIVEKHRGQLSCISSVGKGVEFVIEFPIHLPRVIHQ